MEVFHQRKIPLIQLLSDTFSLSTRAGAIKCFLRESRKGSDSAVYSQRVSYSIENPKETLETPPRR